MTRFRIRRPKGRNSMQTDWREEVGMRPEVVESRREVWRKLRALGSDPTFVKESTKLNSKLERAFAIDPESVERFFRTFGSPTGKRAPEIRRFISTIHDSLVRESLNAYVEYFARFAVRIRFESEGRRFRFHANSPPGRVFHAKVSRGRLKPVRPNREKRASPFESEDVTVPEALRPLIESGSARFVQLDDSGASSSLYDLEEFAYFPDGPTVILHCRQMPYVLCVIGERTSSATLRKLERAIHALQKTLYGRVNAGKPANVRQMRKIAAALKRPGVQKDKAIVVGKTTNAWSSQANFSRQKRKLT